MPITDFSTNHIFSFYSRESIIPKSGRSAFSASRCFSMQSIRK